MKEDFEKEKCSKQLSESLIISGVGEEELMDLRLMLEREVKNKEDLVKKMNKINSQKQSIELSHSALEEELDSVKRRESQSEQALNSLKQQNEKQKKEIQSLKDANAELNRQLDEASEHYKTAIDALNTKLMIAKQTSTVKTEEKPETSQTETALLENLDMEEISFP